MIVHLLGSTPFLIVVLNSVVAGAIGALVLVQFVGASLTMAVIGAIVTAILVLVAQMLSARRRVVSSQQLVRPIFPTPRSDDRPGA
jgi:tetrahydromethanopterin S-methyltransferase subunit E